MIEPVFQKPPPEGDGTEAPKPKRFWWRFLLGAFLIVVAVAGATAASGILFFDNLADALSHNDRYSKLERLLAKVDGGEPENILILGSDKRASLPGDPGRSDTTMLLRLDPDRNAIALMSIPRDLKVEIPGYGTEKFNAAYTYGGPKLTLRVVKELTGLPINHVVNVDFLGFVQRRLRDRLRLRRHRPPLLPLQRRIVRRICRNQRPAGLSAALREKSAAVRPLPPHRHRPGPRRAPAGLPQRRPPAGPGRRPLLRPRQTARHLHRIHDVRHQRRRDDDGSAETVHRLAQRRDPRGPLPGRTGPELRHRLAGSDRRRGRKFLGIEASEGSRGTLEGEPDEGRQARRRQEEAKKKKEKPRVAAPKPPGSDELVPAREAGEMEAKIVARKVGGGFPVFYPTRLPSGAAYEESNPYLNISRPARLPLQGHRRQAAMAAYRMVLTVDLADGTHYFGVQGIQGWSDPPILSRPERNARDPRPRVRDLHRRRPRQADRLAPRRQQLLDRQRPAQHADQRPDARHGALRGRDRPQPEAEEEKGCRWRRRMSR